MPYLVCAEEMERRWIAHAPDLPGCFTSHKERETAIAAVPAAVEEYVAWCGAHGLSVSGLSGPMIVDEVIRAWDFDDEVEVNAFFASDRPPLLNDEIPEIEWLLRATRQDLLTAAQGLDAEDLGREISGERWPIAGILGHVANAEWWYLDRLGLAFPRGEIPGDPFERLERVRGHFLGSLPALVQRIAVIVMGGETWSARKVLRRTLWHERDHTRHIQGLRPRFR